MDLSQFPDRQWDPESIPKISEGLAEGFYRVRIAEIEAVYTEKEPPRLMFVVQLTVIEPPQLAGTPAMDRFCVGTVDDPDALDPETLKQFAGQRLLQFIEGCGVKPERSLARSLQLCEGMQAIVKVQMNKEGSRTELRRYYLLGKQLVGPLRANANGPAPAQRAPTATRPAAGPATMVAGTTVRRVGKPNTVACRRCGEAIPTKEYPMHARQHEVNDDTTADAQE